MIGVLRAKRQPGEIPGRSIVSRRADRSRSKERRRADVPRLLESSFLATFGTSRNSRRPKKRSPRPSVHETFAVPIRRSRFVGTFSAENGTEMEPRNRKIDVAYTKFRRLRPHEICRNRSADESAASGRENVTRTEFRRKPNGPRIGTPPRLPDRSRREFRAAFRLAQETSRCRE